MHALTVRQTIFKVIISQNSLVIYADQLFFLKVMSHKKNCLVILLLGNIINLF